MQGCATRPDAVNSFRDVVIGDIVPVEVVAWNPTGTLFFLERAAEGKTLLQASGRYEVGRAGGTEVGRAGEVGGAAFVAGASFSPGGGAVTSARSRFDALVGGQRGGRGGGQMGGGEGGRLEAGLGLRSERPRFRRKHVFET